jgi:hypothetical protein
MLPEITRLKNAMLLIILNVFFLMLIGFGIEIDENKHDTYDCSCENKRIMQISQDVGHTPIVLIRFNPDKYTDDTGNKITSCWGLDGKNIMSIKKCKVKEWTERMNALNNQIQYWVDNPTDKTVETIQLFY